MDQTELFKATVRTLRLRMRREGASSSSLNSSILPKSSRKSTAFTKQAKDVAVLISKLQEFLLKHRKDYIDSAGHLLGGGSAMTDNQRDQIDCEAQKFIQLSRDQINALQEHMGDEVMGEQTKLYRQAVYESLHAYLKRVTQLYSEQRAIRVKRIVDKKRISRLQPDRYRRLLGSSSRLNSTPQAGVDCEPTFPDTSLASAVSPAAGESDEDAAMSSASRDLSGPASDSTSPRGGGRGGGGGGGEGRGEREREMVTGSSDNSAPAAALFSHQPVAADDSSDLTEEEKAAFALENEQLFEHMNTMVDEVRQIEGKVIEISKLQELFSEKVLQQSEQIDSIAAMTVESTENVSEGNEQVRKAIKNRASLRIWILFVLIVLSFALLFLDWYS